MSSNPISSTTIYPVISNSNLSPPSTRRVTAIEDLKIQEVVTPSFSPLDIKTVTISYERTPITTVDIENAVLKLRQQLNTPEVMTNLQKIAQEQEVNSLKLLAQPTCNLPTLNSIREHVGSFNASELANLTRTQLQNPQALHAAMCVADSVVYSSSYDKGSTFLNDRLRNYLTNLQRIGQNDHNILLLADFAQAKDMFLIKVNTDANRDDLMHELIVGLYGTNLLRRLVPNFAYIYAGFKCSPPLFDGNKVITWCLPSNGSKVNYLLYENIYPAAPLTTFIQKCSGSQWLNLYLQVLYSLRTALATVDFTHYDLNPNNVLLRNLSSISGPFQIPYPTENGQEYLTSDFVATLMNFECSHITYNKASYGKNGLLEFSIYPYRSWIMHDCYKLLMFSIKLAMDSQNTEVLIEANKVFKFFNSIEESTDAAKKQFNTLYSLPRTESTIKLNIDDFLRYIRRVCNCSFLSSQRTSLAVLDCEILLR